MEHMGSKVKFSLANTVVAKWLPLGMAKVTPWKSL
jgi:hypothetical protein